MSHARASSQPPPSANPFTAAIVGFGMVSSSRPHSWPSAPHSRAASTPSSLMYLMSAPAAKARSPAPVRTITRVPASLSASCSRSRSAVSVATSSAFMASGRSSVRTATPPSSETETLIGPWQRAERERRSDGHLRADEVHDLARRRARREHLGHAALLELARVVAGDRPPDDHEHVLGALVAQPVQDSRHERHVRAGEDGDADGVRVLLDRRLDDLLGRLVKPRIDDLHPGVAKRAGDDLGASVVAVETGL